AFHRDRIIRVAADVEHVLRVASVFFGKGPDLVRLVEDVLGRPREGPQLILQPVELVVSERSAVLAELQRDQVQDDELRDERLRRGDADLDARARVDRLVDLAGEARPDDVGDREGLAAAAMRLPRRTERVRGLAALRGPEDEGPLRRALAVAVLGRELRGGGDARDLLDNVLPDERRVV